MQSKYPDFYKVLITDKLSKKLELDPNLPFVEIEERVKNKSEDKKNVVQKDKIKVS